MPFLRPTLSSLSQQALDDIAAALPTGVPLRNSILAILASTMAGFAHGQLGYLDWIAQQSVPFTAEAEFLQAWAALKGIIRKEATYATGSARLTGLDGTAIAAGTILRRGDGLEYTTAAAATMPALGSVTVPITATLPGATGNADAGILLSLSSPIAGVTSTATSATALIGGSDTETDTALRSRMLQAYANPPQGGSASDYVTWALAVAGVTRAWCLPNGGGPGSVTVYPMFDTVRASGNGFPVGTNGVATAETRAVAATGDQQIVATSLYPLRPAAALVYVYAPIPQPINLTLSNLTPNTADIRAGITAALADLCLQNGTPLGGIIYPSEINAAIESVAGIDHFTLIQPVLPVTTSVGYLPTSGGLVVI